MTLTHNQIACCHQGCYAIITLHPDDEARLRRTHESFYCPAGHSQSFRGKTKDQKRIEQLEHHRDSLREDLNEAYKRFDVLHHALVEGVQVCPLGCGWHGARRLPSHPTRRDLGRFYDRVYADLRDHLWDEHGATTMQVLEGTTA